MAAMMKRKAMQDPAKRVTIIGAVVNLLLSIFKLVIGVISHSHALVADGIHSLSDLLTDALVYATSHYGSQDADEEHPYGHKRIETLGTIILAVLLMMVAIGIIYDAITHLFSGAAMVKPGPAALVMAVISVAANEWLFQITKKVGQGIHSAVVIANAWHHRSDAASSLVVVIGLIGALLGWLFLDSVAAVMVAVLILHMGVMLAWSGMRELIDTGLEYDSIQQIKHIIETTPGVQECHQLRTRSMGGKVFVDVHVIVNPKISVSEGHRIGEQVEQNLFAGVEHMHDVIVHIDPEDDEHCAPCHHLPLRNDVRGTLRQSWQDVPSAQHIDKITLHYLSGNISIELGVARHYFADAAAMDAFAQQIKTRALALGYIKEVQLFFYSL